MTQSYKNIIGGVLSSALVAAVIGYFAALHAVDKDISFQKEVRKKQCDVFLTLLNEDIKLLKRELLFTGQSIKKETPKDILLLAGDLEPNSFIIENDSEYLDCLSFKQARTLSQINHQIVEYNEFLHMNKLLTRNPTHSEQGMPKAGREIIVDLLEKIENMNKE